MLTTFPPDTENSNLVNSMAVNGKSRNIIYRGKLNNMACIFYRYSSKCHSFIISLRLEYLHALQLTDSNTTYALYYLYSLKFPLPHIFRSFFLKRRMHLVRHYVSSCFLSSRRADLHITASVTVITKPSHFLTVYVKTISRQRFWLTSAMRMRQQVETGSQWRNAASAV